MFVQVRDLKPGLRVLAMAEPAPGQPGQFLLVRLGERLQADDGQVEAVEQQ